MFTFLLQDYFKRSSCITALVAVSGVPLRGLGGFSQTHSREAGELLLRESSEKRLTSLF